MSALIGAVLASELWHVGLGILLVLKLDCVCVGVSWAMCRRAVVSASVILCCVHLSLISALCLWECNKDREMNSNKCDRRIVPL